MQNHELLAWLGPAADEMTPEQIERVRESAADLDQRYPDADDQDLREAALTATVQHLLGDTTAEDADRALVSARLAEARAFAAAVQIAVELVRDGQPKATAARRCGINRMSLLQALGQR
jgi:hypothetical protein